MSPPARPPALVLVDVQRGFDEPAWGARNNPEAEARIAELLAGWRAAGWPLAHVRHMSTTPGSPLRPELPGNAWKPEAEPEAGEPRFEKTAHSAFVGTGLEDHLRREGIGEVVVVGLTTDHCVSTTARMAADLGFAVTVVDDATATFDRTGPDGARHSADEMHRLALASLHEEFGRVASTREVLARLGRSAEAAPVRGEAAE
ncbi:MAG TPA: cysteine hydrolase family protein [Thermoanaerobaculia bacterium]|nr:cysteine hydrolase family protein [Thermoanaerobaculia bacterium]